MSLSKNELQDLLKDLELNEETLGALTSLVESHIQGTIASREAEIAELNENVLAAYKELHEAEMEELKEQANRYGEYIREEVTNKVSDYTDYAVKEFIKENKAQFNRLEDYERMKSAFETVKTAFESNGFELNENARFESLQEELSDSKEAFDNLFEELRQTREKLETAEAALVFEAATRNLSETQKEKVRSLSENVSFDTLDELKTGLDMLIEQVKKPMLPTREEYMVESYGGNISPSIAAVLKTL